MIKDYVAVDLETTGLDPKKNKIIEIAAIRVENGVITDRFQTLINPHWKLEERIVELTGISDEDVMAAPSIEEKIGEFLEFAKDQVLLGHSVLFDYSFVKRAAVNCRYSYEASAIDTLKIARKYLAELPSRNLHALCEHYGIAHQAHRAMADAEATHELYCRLQEFYKEETAADFEAQVLHYQVKREGPATKAQKERLVRLLEQHKIHPEYRVEKLTKNEASRMIDRIILEYGRPN